MTKSRPFLIVLLFLTPCAAAQLPAQARHDLRFIDSLTLQCPAHHQYTGSRAPLFAQPAMAPAAIRSINAMAGRVAVEGSQSAAMTVCYDTSGRYFLQEDSMTYYVDASLRSADGNVFISGEWISRNNYSLSGGFLMKCSDSGTVQWARLYDSLNHTGPSYYYFYSLLELQDGSIMMAGGTYDQPTGNDDLVLTHTDNNGNIIWSKAYKSRRWTGNGHGSADYFAVKQMAQDPSSGDIFLNSPHWSEGHNITRVRITDGSLAWSRYYQPSVSFSNDQPYGLVADGNELISFSHINGYYGGSYTAIYRVNKTNGDTLSTRYFVTTDPTGFNLGVQHTGQVTKLNNGHYALPGTLYKSYHFNDNLPYLYHAGVQEFDATGNFVKAYCLRNNIESNAYNTRIQVNPDGTGVFSMLKYIASYTADVYYVQFADGQLLHQRVRHYINEGLPGENPALRLPDGSDLVVKLLGDGNNGVNKVEFLDLHLSDSSSACLGLADSATFTEPYYMTPASWGLSAIPSNDLYETRNRTISVRNTTPYFVHACRQLSHCDTLSLVLSSDTICFASPVVLTARKTPGCGAGVFMDYDTAMVQSWKQLNDSSFLFNFKSAGQTMLHGSLRGCLPLLDSVKITVLRSKGAVNLGPDTVLCPGNSMRLHAGKGYATYRWQDGTVDSVLTVTQPGIYSVTVTDSCGNPYSDIVQVSPHAPIPFSIGPDRNKCNTDTLQLRAPAGFLDYTWGPQYNINTGAGPSVVVNPLTDTIYYAQAEKTAGCFAYDTLRITVFHSPAINLGNDTSFCYGDSTLLDAGPGFSNYLWSNGNNAGQQVVYTAGNWWVKGTDAHGCNSYDTLRVLQVWPLPVINMDHDSLLCSGSERVLQPGHFAGYGWQDGSMASSFTVAGTGRYWVTVTDINHCQASDTIVISSMLAPPADFLPADTAMCVYGKLELTPLRPFRSYLWSTGGISSSVILSKAGVYRLEATDVHGCVGSDTILVSAKDCLMGFHMPGAFSPNGDGNNDLLRPLVGGLLAEYNFTIYNRFGQLVFNSHEISQGWNGYFHGQPQDAGVYVWTCTYRFEGQARQIEKGTVMLIR